ncbi:MAG: ATP-binding protein [Polyangiaceae bacterium]
MATAAQIKALIESQLQGDDRQFMTVAMQIAAHAARKGQGRLADDIRALVEQARERRQQRRASKPVPIAAARGELEGLLAVSYPEVRLSELVLDAKTRQRLDRIVQEYRARSRLLQHALEPRRKLLLVGPPGSGKTYTASALAGELGLPLLVIRLDGLITKFMGETAAKLRLVFDSMAKTRGVYLFDEFDSIGGDRGERGDVGEIRRVLNSFLQFIEHDDSDSLVVAATNFGPALDPALFRRFDDIIEYRQPTAPEVEELLRSRLSPFDTRELDWKRAIRDGGGLSYADLARACTDAAKDAVLAGGTTITTSGLLGSLAERKNVPVTR